MIGKGLFITTEGTDGSGKTTQIQLLYDYLVDCGYDVILTREPGGTQISEKIRHILLDIENKNMGILTEMIMYAASRAQIISELIRPSLELGKIVICDRFVDSSYVYQGFGRGIPLETIKAVNDIALDGISPDITLFFDISPDIALERRKNATGADRIENEKLEFHMNVYNGYKKIAAIYPERIKTIDSTKTIAEIFIDVKHCVDIALNHFKK